MHIYEFTDPKDETRTRRVRVVVQNPRIPNADEEVDHIVEADVVVFVHAGRGGGGCFVRKLERRVALFPRRKQPALFALNGVELEEMHSRYKWAIRAALGDLVRRFFPEESCLL